MHLYSNMLLLATRLPAAFPCFNRAQSCCIPAHDPVLREEQLQHYLHKIQHVTDQLLARGITLDFSDAWVERLMRQRASMIVKCALPTVLLYSCIGC